MSHRLTEEQKDQLEAWIGDGPKNFTLLYSFSKDAPNGPTFHQKCDGQGPTVTVLYNTQGSIYGGYASVSWESTDKTIHDANAFLFQLVFCGSRTVNQFLCKNPQNAIFSYKVCGPVFGKSGHDLWTFNNAMKALDGTFTLDGNMSSFGSNYDNKGIQASKVSNDINTVVELEVYKVTGGWRHNVAKAAKEPWRDLPELNRKYVDQLKEDIGNIKPSSESGMSRFRILLLGPVGSGKSSFINTINSVFKGRISHKVPCGTGRHSITTEYMPHNVRSQSGGTLPFLLCDTRGLEDVQGPDVVECNFLLDGHMPPGYEFNPARPISVGNPKFVLKPSTDQMMHCVVFVLDAHKVDEISQKVMEKMQNFRTLINQRNIPCAVILTNVDKLGLKDISAVFNSTEVEEVVVKVSEKLGLPINKILPVKNYNTEFNLKDAVSALSLVALQQLLYMCEDYSEVLSDKTATGHMTQQERETTDSDTA